MIRLALAVALALLVSAPAQPTTAPATHVTAADVTRNLRPHPRLLLSPTSTDDIRRKVSANAQFAAAWTILLREANEAVTLPPVERVMTGRRLLGVSREAIRRVMALSMAYRVTRERRYFIEAARRHQQRTSGRPCR